MGKSTYRGAKGGSGVFQRIVNEMPPHRVFCEPFLGDGAVMKTKLPARVNIGLDLDAAQIAKAADFFCDTAVSQYQFYVGDGIDYLRRYPFVGDELVFCDPPYLSTARQYYHYAMTEAQHADLLDILVTLRCAVLLVGYDSQLYATRLHTWRRVAYTANTHKGQTRETWLWMNYDPPQRLHDDRFLGDNHVERQQLKRIYQWMTRNLLALSPLWRQATLVRVIEACPPEERQIIAERVYEALGGVTPADTLQDNIPCDTPVTPGEVRQSGTPCGEPVTPQGGLQCVRQCDTGVTPHAGLQEHTTGDTDVTGPRRGRVRRRHASDDQLGLWT